MPRILVRACRCLYSWLGSSHRRTIHPRYLTNTNEWNIYEAIQQDPSAALFHNHVALGTRAKLFFVTENGYYGTASATIECNDYVVLVSGLQVPLIVRPTEGKAGHYKLLGPAFVNGMMSGELWPETEEDLVDLTIV